MKSLNIYEFGKENKKTVLLLHPSGVMWDYFEYVIPLLKDDYRLLVPALPGYDKNNPSENFISIEDTAKRVEEECIKRKIYNLDLSFGCCMGGSIVLRMLMNKNITSNHTILDAAITPYQIPYIITRFILLRDYLMVSMGKLGGVKLIAKAFSTDEYTDKDYRYIADVLKFMSHKTIWNTFDSTNNYSMPEGVFPDIVFQYWYGDKEKKNRAWDIKYIKKHFPNTEFVEFKNCGHGSISSLFPEKMAMKIREILENE